MTDDHTVKFHARRGAYALVLALPGAGVDDNGSVTLWQGRRRSVSALRSGPAGARRVAELLASGRMSDHRHQTEADVEEAKQLWAACLMDVLSASPSACP
ncbi:hypothetical protein [[Actinomadura] parvosata]|uniref:hypothetical protein n=1 Tax=[Actinomadura] parvosata TaxID=1955412 RepID=UPI001645B3B4